LNYNKLFIMMQEEDKGFGRSGKPTGYLKLETKDSRGKALVHVQNIGLLGEHKVLKAYLFSSLYPNTTPMHLGTIKLKGDSGDVVYEFNKNDFQKKSGVNVDLLDTVVIMCKDTVMENGLSTFPLVGFKNQRWNWKEVFSVKSKEEKETQHEVDETEDKTPQESNTIKIPMGFVWNKEDEGKDADTDTNKDKEINENLDLESDTIISENKDMDVEVNKEKAENHPEKIWDNLQEQFENESIDLKLDPKNIKEEKRNSAPDTNDILESTCKECKTAQQEIKSKDKQNNIYTQLSKYMVHEEPFTNGDMGYKWWLINDCRFILDNDYSNANTVFLLYNPYIVNIVHRYGHYLFGVKEDELNQVQYICYAIPSRYGIDPHPLLPAQAYAYWVPKKGERWVIGAIGYWIISIDTQSGELITLKV
jgi:hypothetical protein